jgi:hypothetical protein
VVSKEEVAVGRKGSGGAWGSTSRNVGLARPAPRVVEYEHWQKNQAKMSVVGLWVTYNWMVA